MQKINKQQIESKIRSLISEEHLKSSNSLGKFLSNKGYEILNLDSWSIELLAKVYSAKKQFVLDKNVLDSKDYEFMDKASVFVGRLNRIHIRAIKSRKRKIVQFLNKVADDLVKKALYHFMQDKIDNDVLKYQIPYLENSKKSYKMSKEESDSELISRAWYLETKEKTTLDYNEEVFELDKAYRCSKIRQL